MNKNIFKSKQFSVKWILLFIVIAIVVFYTGFIIGSLRSVKTNIASESKAIFSPFWASEQIEGVDFDLFWDVWTIAQDSYLRQPVDDIDLFYGSLEGMVDSLGDQYSVFFDPEMAEEFTKDLEGSFFGIGAEIAKKDGYIVVVAPLEGSPAELAGVRSGDKILAVDGEDIFDWSVSEAVMKIRGKEGEDVALTLYRDDSGDSFEVSIVRSEIIIDSVEWEIREDGIGVIEVFMFNDDTTTFFRNAVQDLLEADVDGIVLDLRNNPGGLLTEAINLAGFWIEDGTVVIERVGDEEFEFEAPGTARLSGIPTVVLVNGGSASGSEILAGALQDYGVAVLIGEQTFGKGSVQEYHEFKDGSALKVTVAEWLTPLGRSINEIGIEPNIIIEFTIEDYNAGNTPQFDKAIDYLKG